MEEAPPASPQLSLDSREGRRALLASVLGSAMPFLDGTAVNVALPSMARDMGTSFSGFQWILNAYLIALAALVLPGGALSDRWGRRHSPWRPFSAGSHPTPARWSWPGRSRVWPPRSSSRRASRWSRPRSGPRIAGRRWGCGPASPGCPHWRAPSSEVGWWMRGRGGPSFGSTFRWGLPL